MKIENTKVFNLDGAFRAMRNPLDSWDKSDSEYDSLESNSFLLGENDLKLAKRLILAGTEHRKFLRQILVCVDITAPRFWWTEFDTYKIGVVRNSCSTMHKMVGKEFTQQSFEYEIPKSYLKYLNKLRTEAKNNPEMFLKLKNLLPEGYLQKSTVTLNYENIRTMYHHRRFHKLPQWRNIFCEWVKYLPYNKELIRLGESELK